MLVSYGIVASASGSKGGVTASHNRYGAYLRDRAIPVNPNSDRQATARGRFQSAVDLWSSSLTEANRQAWNLYAANISWLNKLGETVYLPGFAHYVRSYCAMLAAGLSPVSAGPTTFSLPGSDPSFAATVNQAAQLVVAEFDTGLDWVNEDGAGMLISMSEPKGSGRAFIGGPYRDAGSVEGDSVTPPTSPQSIAVPWAVTAGQIVEVRARIIRADGRVSQLFRTIETVIAGP